MKQTTLLLTLWALFGLTSPARADDNILQLDIFSVPKITAMRLMDDARIVADPGAVLDAIERLKGIRQASLVATQFVKGKLPLRTHNEGKIHMEVDAGSPRDGIADINIALDTKQGSHSGRLVTAVQVKPGAPKFLGTLEPPDPKEKNNTWLVFVRLR